MEHLTRNHGTQDGRKGRLEKLIEFKQDFNKDGTLKHFSTVGKEPRVGDTIDFVTEMNKQQHERIKELAQKIPYHKSSKVPSAFHITLGYLYKAVPSNKQADI